MASLPDLPANFARAVELIDAAHAEDPTLTAGGVPYELHYARKMTRWLAERCSDAAPTLQVACRAQHFRRWELPRASFPMTRPGYLLWRAKCKTQAAAQVSSLLSSGIEPPLAADKVERIAALIAKQNLARDPETQVLEDVACLVFLDDQFDAFESKENIDEEKIIAILQKTWVKMSEEGQALALKMELSERAKTLISKALNG